jgi:hypothetical protein
MNDHPHFQIAPDSGAEQFNCEMADFTLPHYGPAQLRAASAALRATGLALNDETIEAFRIAHNWRSAHIFPMMRVRYELGGKVRSFASGGTTASRLKRMSSIRKKLRKIKHSLYSMQGLAGCRAIVRDKGEADSIVDFYRSGQSRHKLADEMDYISRPKSSGY